MLRILDDGALQGAENMARDEALLASAATPTLRLYSWDPPCLSLGLFQDYQRVLATAPKGCSLVRRITGGGSIYHIHEVTYAIVGELGSQGFPSRLQDCYPLFHTAIQTALAAAGAAGLQRQPERVGDHRYSEEVRCFASPAAQDLVSAQGGKALGSAGRNRSGRFLVHGSLKIAGNPWDGEAVAACGLDAEGARAALIAAFRQILPAPHHFGQWQESEREEVERIRAQRYSNSDWLEHRQGPRP